MVLASGRRLAVIQTRQGSTAYIQAGLLHSMGPSPVDKFQSTGGGDGYGNTFLNSLLGLWDIMRASGVRQHPPLPCLVASHGCSRISCRSWRESRVYPREKELATGNDCQLPEVRRRKTCCAIWEAARIAIAERNSGLPAFNVFSCEDAAALINAAERMNRRC